MIKIFRIFSKAYTPQKIDTIVEFYPTTELFTSKFGTPNVNLHNSPNFLEK